MWNVVLPVSVGYDPIIGESPQPLSILAMNCGPDTVHLRAWASLPQIGQDQPSIELELRPGSQRFVVACLVRLQIDIGGQFAAVAAQVREA